MTPGVLCIFYDGMFEPLGQSQVLTGAGGIACGIT